MLRFCGRLSHFLVNTTYGATWFITNRPTEVYLSPQVLQNFVPTSNLVVDTCGLSERFEENIECNP